MTQMSFRRKWKHEKCVRISKHTQKPNAPVPRGLGLASALLASGSGVTNQFSIRCAFCQKPHYSASCEDVCDVNKRKEILKRDGRCFVCLRKGHITKQCDKRCRKCEGLPHQSICKGQDHPKELSKNKRFPRALSKQTQSDKQWRHQQ